MPKRECLMTTQEHSHRRPASGIDTAAAILAIAQRQESPVDVSDAEAHVTQLVARAAARDRAAWDEIVDRYVALLWNVALKHGLSESDAADVVQTTWLRLLEHIGDIRDPSRLSSWLATTAQREAYRVIALRRRVVPTGDDEGSFDGPDHTLPDPDEQLLAAERAVDLRRAVEVLPRPWQRLVGLLVSDPPLSYQEISRQLDLPVGSIGPTRGRCMARLRPLVAR